MQSSVRTSQETHYVSATKPSRWMMFREIITVYCENHTEHINTLCEQNAEFSSYLTGNTICLRYKVQPVNAVQGNNRCLLWELYGTHKYIVWAACRYFLMLKLVVKIVPLFLRGMKFISVSFIANCASGSTVQVACYTYDQAVGETLAIHSCSIVFGYYRKPPMCGCKTRFLSQ
jgi:hypothetical protein